MTARTGQEVKVIVQLFCGAGRRAGLILAVENVDARPQNDRNADPSQSVGKIAKDQEAQSRSSHDFEVLERRKCCGIGGATGFGHHLKANPSPPPAQRISNNVVVSIICGTKDDLPVRLKPNASRRSGPGGSPKRGPARIVKMSGSTKRSRSQMRCT